MSDEMDHRKPLPTLDFITNSVRMPSIPTVFSKVEALAQNPNSSIVDLARVVETDQSIAARMLRMANSAAFGLQSRVGSITQAASTLGMLRVRNIVLQTSLMENFSEMQAQGFDLEEFWKHATLTGVLCRQLASGTSDGLGIGPEEAYTCGLLHDIGMLVLADTYPSAFFQCLERRREQEIAQEDAELAVFGFNHSEVGAALAQNWKFPDPIVLSIRWHHGVQEGTSWEGLCLLVHLANAITEAIMEGKEPLVGLEKAMDRAAKRAGLSAGRLAKAAEELTALAGTIDL